MKFNFIKILILLFTLVIFQNNMVFADKNKNDHLEVDSSNYKVKLEFSRENFVGENELHVEFSDKEGNKINPSKVNVSARLEGMEQEGSEMQGDDVYIALEIDPEMSDFMGMVNFDKAGEWNLKISYTIKGQNFDFEVPVKIPDSDNTNKNLILSIFLFFNIEVVLLALVNKYTS